jgi:hypothetical protein
MGTEKIPDAWRGGSGETGTDNQNMRHPVENVKKTEKEMAAETISRIFEHVIKETTGIIVQKPLYKFLSNDI